MATSLDDSVIDHDEIEDYWKEEIEDNNCLLCGPSSTKYFLTGITTIEYAKVFHPYVIPKDPNVARIGGKAGNLQYDDTFVQFHAANIETQASEFQDENIGFIVHAHCWALFNHIMPTALVEKKLEKFIRAGRKYWRNNRLWGIQDWEQKQWKSGHGRTYKGFEFGCDIYKNPLIVPEVQKVVDNARKTKKEYIAPRCSHVPLEVATMIAEWTCPIDYTPADVKNTRNMLSAWQWTLPDCFWKVRLKEELFVELTSLRESNYSIDWQALRLDLMALVSDREWYVSSGLPNRERVIGFMTAIKSNFLKIA
ncbi:hypothetical protein N7519_005951 [Penicillium mononematosum]|uniref:uncharacterized protein n=1 Tax=Penicillium mononematosum TaxID=268346 RepID=UPI002547CC60|nr:uncharacterized protein N7519_005951 [Penicillium mononematosum]KAJ6184650.1 hypothetical protein N7519_005951 [Penicillium mononematosum]